LIGFVRSLGVGAEQEVVYWLGKEFVRTVVDEACRGTVAHATKSAHAATFCEVVMCQHVKDQVRLVVTQLRKARAAIYIRVAPEAK
jgi:hypothetical protein